MKTRILFISMFLYSVSEVSFSQTSEESNDSLLKIFSTSNVVRISYPVTIGTETSGFFYNSEYPWIETYGVSLALYSGEPFSYNKMRQSITRHSPLYHTFNEKPSEYKYSNTFILFSPGISLYSTNRKYSLDLFKKDENQIFIQGSQQIAPYKVNFHF